MSGLSGERCTTRRHTRLAMLPRTSARDVTMAKAEGVPGMADVGAGPPPGVALMQMAQGFMVAKALQMAAILGIADLLAGGARSVADLAVATGTHEQSLGRLLRALASREIFRQETDGCYVNTPLSNALRSELPGSARDYVIYAPHDGNVQAWVELDHVLQTGEQSFVRANGVDVWGYFAAHPDVEQSFNRAMTALSFGTHQMILDVCDFSRFDRILDVGGGEGRLLAAILAEHPQARGTVFDLPAATRAAEQFLQAEGLDHRADVKSGDMFVSVPPEYDAYVLKNILHDWSDEQCVKILRVCRSAMRPGNRLIVLDAVIAPGNQPHPAKWFDLHMMVALGGRERSKDEFAALLDAAGFALESAVSLPAPIGVVEAIPV